jgi:nitrogen regulatory protein P-II 1
MECIVKPHKLDAIKEALTKFGVSGMTIYEVKGFGRQRGHVEIYRGAEYRIDFVPKIKIELFVAQDKVEQAIEVVSAAAKTNSIGDGKIVVLAIESITRIRTGERDMDAL